MSLDTLSNDYYDENEHSWTLRILYKCTQPGAPSEFTCNGVHIYNIYCTTSIIIRYIHRANKWLQWTKISMMGLQFRPKIQDGQDPYIHVSSEITVVLINVFYWKKNRKHHLLLINGLRKHWSINVYMREKAKPNEAIPNRTRREMIPTDIR